MGEISDANILSQSAWDDKDNKSIVLSRNCFVLWHEIEEPTAAFLCHTSIQTTAPDGIVDWIQLTVDCLFN